MRFLYKDSQGKEVSIPSVDALALRMELGAITENTQFYDSSTDRWAPAGEHEVFRSLQREAEDKSAGFVAPPPAPLPPPPAVPRPAPPAKAAAEEAPAEEAPAEEAPAEEAPSVPDAPPDTAKTRAPNPFETIEGPAAEEEPAPQEFAASPAEPGGHDVLGGLDLGLTLDESALLSGPAPVVEPSDADSPSVAGRPEPETPTPVRESSEGFDFQGFGGALVEEDDGEEGQEEDDEAEEGPAAQSPAAQADGGLELEGVLDASYDLSGSTGGAVSAERIETDGPLAAMDAEQTSDWAGRVELEGEEPAETPERHSADPKPRPAGAGERSPPRARPPSSEREKASSGVPVALVAGVALVLLAGGGWFGLSLLRGGGEDGVVLEEEIDPPVTIPEIPVALEPRMREVAALALGDWVVTVRDTLPAERGIPAEPDAAWLGSRYLAEAGRFSSVAEYWQSLGLYVTEVLNREQALFVAALDARLVDSTGVTDPDAQLLRARAGAGFQSGRPDRRLVYRQLQAVIDAATDLHRFLVENEDRIDYQPHPEGDPVLEAVAATSDLGDEMWDRVDGITAALDRLGALDKVTTERLLALATQKFQGVGVR